MGSLRGRVLAFLRRLERVERRELRELREWLERTRNLLHLSIILFVPLLIGIITYLFNRVDILPFLLFPPLASGTYTLFAEPESRYADPRRFVGGMTTGALCGWVALVLTTRVWYDTPSGPLTAHAGAAAFGVFLTGVVTWALDIEEPTAFSTALLVLVVGTSQLEYVLSIAVSSSVVAGVFWVWRREFYEQRARYLYQSTKGDDHVLVPMRGDDRVATALLGARLAAAHDAGKVVLLDVVDDDAVATAERELLDETVRDAAADAAVTTDGGPDALPYDRETDAREPDDEGDEGDEGAGSFERDALEADVEETLDRDEEDRSLRERAAGHVVTETATQLESCAAHIEREIGVPCEVVVAVSDGAHAKTVLEAARTANCDLIVTGYEAEGGSLSSFVRTLFRGDIDTLVHRSTGRRTDWRRVLVPVRSPSAVSHTMLDFAERLAETDGTVAACHCIGEQGDRRAAERMLADLVETCSYDVETRVARARIEEYLEGCAPEYDLIVIGASTDRSTASRFFSPPTFQRLDAIDCDIAIVHR